MRYVGIVLGLLLLGGRAMALDVCESVPVYEPCEI